MNQVVILFSWHQWQYSELRCHWSHFNYDWVSFWLVSTEKHLNSLFGCNMSEGHWLLNQFFALSFTANVFSEWTTNFISLYSNQGVQPQFALLILCCSDKRPVHIKLSKWWRVSAPANDDEQDITGRVFPRLGYEQPIRPWRRNICDVSLWTTLNTSLNTRQPLRVM
jgi:hypothetical protein